MSFVLDAWIDTKTPQIRILSDITSSCVLEFSADETQSLLSDRIIDIEDLLSNDGTVKNQVIRDLFLFASCRDIACPGKEINHCPDCVQASRAQRSGFRTMAMAVRALLNLPQVNSK